MTTLNTISGDGMKEARLVYLNQPQAQPQPAPDAFDNLHVRAEDQRGDMFEQKYDRVYDQVESRLSEYDTQTNDLVRSLDDAFAGATEQEEQGDDAALQQYDAAVESLSGELRMSFKKTESGTYAKLSEIESRYSQIENVIAELERALAERGQPVDRTFREDATAEREQAALQSGEIRSVDIHSSRDGFKSIEVKPAYFLVRMPASFKPDFGPAASEVKVMPASGGAQYLRITEAGAQMLDGKTISITTGDGTKINATVSRASSQYGNVIFTYEKRETAMQATSEPTPVAPAPEAAPAPETTPGTTDTPEPADTPASAEPNPETQPIMPEFAEEPVSPPEPPADTPAPQPESPPEPPAEAETPAAPEAADESVESLKNQFAESVNRIVISIEGGMVGQAEMEVDAANAILKKITNPFEKTAAMVQAGLMAEKQGDNGMTERSSTPKIIEGEENTGTYELFAGGESDRIFLEKQEVPAEEASDSPPEPPMEAPQPAPEAAPVPEPEGAPETQDFFGQVKDAVEGIRQQIYSGAEPTTIEVSRAVTELNDLIKANEYSKDDALMLSGVMNGVEVTNSYNQKTYVIGLDDNNQVAVTEKAEAAPEAIDRFAELRGVVEGVRQDIYSGKDPSEQMTRDLNDAFSNITSEMDREDAIDAVGLREGIKVLQQYKNQEQLISYDVTTDSIKIEAVQPELESPPEPPMEAPQPAPEAAPAPEPESTENVGEQTAESIAEGLIPDVKALVATIMDQGPDHPDTKAALDSLNNKLTAAMDEYQGPTTDIITALDEKHDASWSTDSNDGETYAVVTEDMRFAIQKIARPAPEAAPAPAPEDVPAPPEDAPEAEPNDLEAGKGLMKELQNDIAEGGMSAEAQDRLVQINRLSDQTKETLADSYGIDSNQDLDIPGNGGKTYAMSYDEGYKSFSITEKAARPASETTPTEPQPGGGEVDPNNEPIEPDEPEAEEETPPADAETPENTETETETEPETEEETQPASAETSESSEANEQVQELIRQLKELIESAKKMIEDMKKAQEEARNTPAEDDSASAETPAEDSSSTPSESSETTDTKESLEADIARLESERGELATEWRDKVSQGYDALHKDNDAGFKRLDEISVKVKEIDEQIAEKKAQLEALENSETLSEDTDELIEKRGELNDQIKELTDPADLSKVESLREQIAAIDKKLEARRTALDEELKGLTVDDNDRRTEIQTEIGKINDVIGEQSAESEPAEESGTPESSEQEGGIVDLKSALETVMPGISVETSGNSVTLTFKTKEQAAAALKAVQYIDSMENITSFLPTSFLSPTAGVSLTENSENKGLISGVEAVAGNDKAIRVDVDSGNAIASPVTSAALVAAMNMVRYFA